MFDICRCGGIGRRKGLKIPRWRHRAGSSPATGTIKGTENEPIAYQKNGIQEAFLYTQILRKQTHNCIC